jgi:hypothetical protein
MPTLTKIILTAIGLWFLTLILLFIFPYLLPIISGFAILLSLPIALVLLVLALIALIKEEGKRWPVVCISLILAVSYIALSQVPYWGALTHLSLNKQSYEITAQKMLAAQDDAERQSICGEKCWLPSSDHGLVAFHYVHGFLNWHDIIYDPSGQLVALRTWDEKRRFDIYFISAEHLTGNWYLAHFGD